MVWHNGLLQKLHKLDIHGNMINFIQNFLKDRTIKVGLGNTISDPQYVQNGTAQGSVISPTLFNIMIDDIFENKLAQIQTAKYVDDAAIWTSSKTIGTAKRRVQETLTQIQHWASKWGFNINTTKTIGVVFQPKYTRQLTPPKLYINHMPIPFKNQVKFLGLTFDKYLTWAPHITDTVNKCTKDLNCSGHSQEQNGGQTNPHYSYYTKASSDPN